MLKIVGISGSLRTGSLNTSLLNAINNKFANNDNVDFEMLSIDLPIYTGNEITGEYPESVLELREAVASGDGIVITCPEYNWNITVALKNAIDWLSMGGSSSPIHKKVIAIAGVGGGRLGSVRAQMALRTTLLHNQSWVIPGPEVLIAPNEKTFDKDNNLNDDFANMLLDELLNELVRVAPLL
ncbi:MAG: NAD(P)H-dependent oxidoreductase [Acidimicrobiia bacterium]|nr:NAD(P)H-dependent oxidoreductase [Acidimicrobiia bacterium]